MVFVQAEEELHYLTAALVELQGKKAAMVAAEDVRLFHGLFLFICMLTFSLIASTYGEPSLLLPHICVS
jgi:hypothetical protein